jgi:orotidine-5'-phosphate decarboxylase
MTPHLRIFCAIDTRDVPTAAFLAERVTGQVGGIKLGLEFFMANGPEGVRKVRAGQPGLPLFLDIKLHDIPNTVAGAIRSVTALEPQFITLHAAGGAEMMRAARSAAEEEAARLRVRRPQLLAVTVLTSLDDYDLSRTGVSTRVEEQVLNLAVLAQESGMDGIVCSPHEVANVRAACGPDFVLMVPGVRPSWSPAQDQKRIMTPTEAVSAGADYIVIGRPITQATDPAASARKISLEMAI